MPSNQPKTERFPSKRPPRNYLARREQLRLLLLVGGLMLIFILMNEARKPQNWRWLTGPAGGPLTAAERGGEEIDTRTAGTSDRAAGDGGLDQIPGAIVTPSVRWKPPDDLDDVDRAMHRVETDFWKKPCEPAAWPSRPELPPELDFDPDHPPEDLAGDEYWQSLLNSFDEQWRVQTTLARNTAAADPHVSLEGHAEWTSALLKLQAKFEAQQAKAASASPETRGDELAPLMGMFDELWSEVDRADRRRRRRQRLDLPRVLKTVRDNRPLSADDAKSWRATLKSLDDRWRQQTEAAIDAVMLDSQLSAEDRGAWLSILQSLQTHWNEQLHDALAAAEDPAALADEQRRVLAEFTELYDELSMQAIRDDTPLARPAEANAWFRLWEYLQQTDQDALAAAETPRVGFRQLFKQPEEYRGKLVRIRGEVKRGYHLRAPRNVDGIEGYYRFVLFPAGGPTDPVLVYTLELPPGFPHLKDRDVDGEVTDLKDVPVEFTGYFFKRAAYQAEDDTRVAPVILARMPTWKPEAETAAAELPNVWLFAGAVGAMALLGIGLAALAFVRRGATPAEKYSPAGRARPQQFAALADEPIAAGAPDHLKHLADDDTAAPTTGQ